MVWLHTSMLWLMDKPRILFIVPLPPPVHGSATVCQSILDSPLVQEAFQTDFVNLSTSRRMDEIGKRNLKKIFRFFGAYVKVLHRLMFRRYDACYLAITCHGIGFLKDAPFVALCKLFRRKVILHQHNKGLSRDVCRWPYRWLMPWVYRDTEVILLSERLYFDVASVVQWNQVHVCPNGVDVPLPVAVSRDSAVPRLLFLSNLIESKGVYVLLDACRELREKGYEFIGDFVGGETREINRETFKNEVQKRGLQENVIYHGPQYGAEKERFFREADIFVQPTFEDCFPLTIVEAMRYGLPVVSTDEGAIPDMVVDGETGFICPRKEVQALVNALEKLLKNSELRKQMGENGCSRYKEKYTLRAFEKTFRGILSDILN